MSAIAHVEAKSAGGPIDPGLRITINFHPDRLHGDVPILRALGRDGVYRSQFETGISNGGLTAFRGGMRLWNIEYATALAAEGEQPAVQRPPADWRVV